MNNLAKYIVVAFVSLLLGGAITKYYFSTPVNEDKKQTVEAEKVKNDIVTVVKEEIKPDGTKETTTTTTDKSEKHTNTKSSESKVTVAKADLFFGGGYVKNIKDSQEKEDYQILVGKRLAGPVLGFVTYQFKGVATVNVVVEF